MQKLITLANLITHVLLKRVKKSTCWNLLFDCHMSFFWQPGKFLPMFGRIKESKKKVQKNWFNSQPQANVCSTSTNVWIVKAMVFSVMMYRCESWTIGNTKESTYLNCRKLLTVPGTERRMNKSIIERKQSDCAWEGLMMRQVEIFWTWTWI